MAKGNIMRYPARWDVYAISHNDFTVVGHFFQCHEVIVKIEPRIIYLVQYVFLNRFRLRYCDERLIEKKDRNQDIDKVHEKGSPDESADFVCFVCGAVFATDDDRRQHLEKEAHGKLRETTTEEEKKLATDQENLEERRTHHI